MVKRLMQVALATVALAGSAHAAMLDPALTVGLGSHDGKLVRAGVGVVELRDDVQLRLEGQLLAWQFVGVDWTRFSGAGLVVYRRPLGDGPFTATAGGGLAFGKHWTDFQGADFVAETFYPRLGAIGELGLDMDLGQSWRVGVVGRTSTTAVPQIGLTLTMRR